MGLHELPLPDKARRSLFAAADRGKRGASGLLLGPQNRFPGALESKNITPHNLGKWTDGEFVRALTVGSLSANLTETPAPLGITVGRWR